MTNWRDRNERDYDPITVTQGGDKARYRGGFPLGLTIAAIAILAIFSTGYYFIKYQARYFVGITYTLNNYVTKNYLDSLSSSLDGISKTDLASMDKSQAFAALKEWEGAEKMLSRFKNRAEKLGHTSSALQDKITPLIAKLRVMRLSSRSKERQKRLPLE